MNANISNAMKLGSTVSDLHLLTNRTSIDRYMDEILQAAAQSDLFIFNGDLFDFKWSLHEELNTSVQKATTWVYDLAKAFPTCQFVMLIGNHDNVSIYMDALNRLARDLPNLAWEQFYLRLGEKVFLHGDVGDKLMTPDEFVAFRHRWDRDHQPAKWRYTLYSIITNSGLHKIVPKLVSKRRHAEHIIAYLQEALGYDFNEIREIFSGHIHSSYTDYRLRGLLFHNTGAAIRGLRFRILQFDYIEDDFNSLNLLT